jgi:hypothetical protein
MSLSTLFAVGNSYEWDAVLDSLASLGCPHAKRGFLESPVPGTPAVVFMSERNSEKYMNAIDRPKRVVVMQVNPAQDQQNSRLRESEAGMPVALFYRANMQTRQDAFTFLGLGRYLRSPGEEPGEFYTFKY